MLNLQENRRYDKAKRHGKGYHNGAGYDERVVKDEFTDSCRACVVHSYGCKRCWVSRQDKQARSSSKASNQNPKAFKECHLRLSIVNNLLAFVKKKRKNF